MPFMRRNGRDYWRGQVDTRMDNLEKAIKNLSVSLLNAQNDIIQSNLKIARYVGAIGLVVALLTFFAPIIWKLFARANP